MPSTSMRDLLRVPAGPVNLAGYDTDGRPGAPVKKKSGKPKPLVSDHEALRLQQEKLFAESTDGGNRSVLLLLQGMDTAGKGGVTEHVVGVCGPIGVEYTAFKRPTPEELRHTFLWRINRRVPPPGHIGVFDRSQYEDVLVVRVHDLVPEAEWQTRYDKINKWEAGLVAKGVTIIKCFLHISYDTQRERLLARLDDPRKNWKFKEADIDERARWSEYTEAYEAALTRCNTEAAPWYIVPSDDKAYRNWAIGELLRETLDEMDPGWPRIDLDLKALKKRLKPPN